MANTTELMEINGYGTFGSIPELKNAISRRKELGEPLMGEAEILAGAVIVRDKDSERLLDEERIYQRMHAKIGPTGKFLIQYDRENFGLNPPEGWEEIENP